MLFLKLRQKVFILCTLNYTEKMTYIEIKEIAGREYRYLRKSVQLADGRIIHPNLKYIGPVDPVYRK